MASENNQVRICLKHGRSKVYDYKKTKTKYRGYKETNLGAGGYINHNRSDRQQKHRAVMPVINANKKAINRLLPHTLTQEQWEHALNYFDDCCAVCGRQPNHMLSDCVISLDHWIPLSHKGSNNPGSVATNAIPLCHRDGGCNNSKHNTMPDRWLKHKFGRRKANKIMARIQEYFGSLQ